MLKHSLPRAFLFVVCLLLPTVVAAQPRGQFELTPTIGYRLEGDFDVEDVEVFDNGLKVKEGEFYGLVFDLPLGRHLQLELLANRQQSELIADAGLFGNDFVLADIDVTYYHVGVLWQFLAGQVRPYVVGSAGLARLDVALPGIDSEDRPSLSLGGGVKVFAGEHVGFRIESRGYYVALDDNDDDRWEDENSLTQGELSVGLILAW